MQGAAFLSEILKTCMKDAKSMAMALNSGLDMAYDNDETGWYIRLESWLCKYIKSL